MKTYHQTSEVTLYPGMSAWHFGHVDRVTSQEIKKNNAKNKTRGFGSIRVVITLGKTTWNTSIFPDKKSGTYLFPIKKEIRKKEGIMQGDHIEYSFQISGNSK